MIPARFAFLERIPRPVWLTSALREIRQGVAEFPGPGSNAVILNYRKIAKIDIKGDDSDVSWCAIGANAMLEENSIVGTRSAMARSFLYHKSCVTLDRPMIGAITVLSSSRGPASGHVGFYVGESGEYIYLAGGNQNDSWSIAGFPRSRVLGYRWPAGQAQLPSPYNAPFPITSSASVPKDVRDA
ncbi:TIGR02594 family protein [Microvirga terricola]|uniref:TIGR02594 family protein n=1 Tax=Microvirga terricola TaxID=2719797 RepID=A0ABX0V6P1_9HYPH|nr:TIGR02594 family protein [Microvirga terricola]NIX75403.1 TIGR02594 family protein [Microvirga terricola]